MELTKRCVCRFLAAVTRFLINAEDSEGRVWDDYTNYKRVMFKKTNIPIAPWEIIDADRKTEARLKTIEYILGQIPYQEK